VHQHPDCRSDAFYGATVGYNTYLYVNPSQPPDSGKRSYGWQLKKKTDYWNRGRYSISALPLWRAVMEDVLGMNCSGLGYIGADFWPLFGKELIIPGIKFSASACARYPESCWDQLNLDRGLEVMLAPGPAGAMPTEVFEQIRQGTQESQARIFLEKAILSGKLDAALAKKCQEVLDERTWHMRSLGSTVGGGFAGTDIGVWFEGAGSAGLAEKLYAAAAEVAAKSK
jgi:hypothetical protein